MEKGLTTSCSTAGDLKLGNILLKSTTTDIRGFLCKICDFGMARLMDSTKSHVSTSTFGESQRRSRNTLSYTVGCPIPMATGVVNPVYCPLCWFAVPP